MRIPNCHHDWQDWGTKSGARGRSSSNSEHACRDGDFEEVRAIGRQLLRPKDIFARRIGIITFSALLMLILPAGDAFAATNLVGERPYASRLNLSHLEGVELKDAHHVPLKHNSGPATASKSPDEASFLPEHPLSLAASTGLPTNIQHFYRSLAR